MMPTVEDVIEERATDLFLENGDVASILESWFREHHSDQELLERLNYLREALYARASDQIQREEDEGPWEAA